MKTKLCRLWWWIDSKFRPKRYLSKLNTIKNAAEEHRKTAGAMLSLSPEVDSELYWQHRDLALRLHAEAILDHLDGKLNRKRNK